MQTLSVPHVTIVRIINLLSHSVTVIPTQTVVDRSSGDWWALLLNSAPLFVSPQIAHPGLTCVLRPT